MKTKGTVKRIKAWKKWQKWYSTLCLRTRFNFFTMKCLRRKVLWMSGTLRKSWVNRLRIRLLEIWLWKVLCWWDKKSIVFMKAASASLNSVTTLFFHHRMWYSGPFQGHYLNWSLTWKQAYKERLKMSHLNDHWRWKISKKKQSTFCWTL